MAAKRRRRKEIGDARGQFWEGRGVEQGSGCLGCREGGSEIYRKMQDWAAEVDGGWEFSLLSGDHQHGPVGYTATQSKPAHVEILQTCLKPYYT